MRLTAPPQDALTEIREHLENVHGWTDFSPDRDVAFPNRTPDHACVAYLPATAFARARYICACCDGGIYIVGQGGHRTPARSAEILSPHPTRGVVLHRGAHDASDLALLVREWSGHRLGQA